MRRLLILLPILAVLAACSVTPPDDDTPDPSLIKLKASGHIETCRPGTATDGGLPNLTLNCLGGGPSVDLSTLKGPLIVNLWARQCGPCRDEMPALEQFHQKWGSKYPVLGIDWLDVFPKQAIQTAIVYGVTYPLVSDPEGRTRGTSLSTAFIPATFLLTADGQVRLVERGGMDSEAQVEKDVAKALGHPLGHPL